MKKIVVALSLVAFIGIGCSGGTDKGSKGSGTTTGETSSKEEQTKAKFSLSEAEKIIKDYVKGMHKVSKVKVYEGKKYYIGEVYLEGYGDNVVRKVYLSKTDKDVILPTMAETFDYEYMVKAKEKGGKASD